MSLTKIVRDATKAEKNLEGMDISRNVSSHFVREKTPLHIAVEDGIRALQDYQGSSDVVKRKYQESAQLLQEFLKDTF